MTLSIIGSGKIVAEALPVISSTPDLTIRSLWARPHSIEHARELAVPYGIPVVTSEYDDILTDTDVDIVYIAIINSAHYNYALRALKAGKHVILEKPACLCARELRHLADVALRRKLMLFEAVTLLHLPAFRLLREQLLPQLGTIRHVECNYSQRSSRLESYLQGLVLPVFDPAAGGGALMDINVYNLHFTVALLGQPASARYFCRRGPNGVDLSGTVVLTYASSQEKELDRFHAICTGSKDTDAPSFGLIQGDEGWLLIEGPVSTMASITISLHGQNPCRVALEPVSHRMKPEFCAFTSLIANQNFNSAHHLLSHSIAVLDVIDSLQKSSEKH